VKYRILALTAVLTTTLSTGCYLYSPDVTLDSEVKANPRSYICAPSSAHPMTTMKRETVGWVREDGACDYPPLDPISSVPIPASTSDKFRNDQQLRSAIAYADYASDQYMAAKRQGGAIPPFLATVLAPVGGTALALGSLGIGSTVVTALGAGAGTITGAASVVQSRDREKIYVTGSAGIQCLLTNMQPYTYIELEKLSELDVWLVQLAFWRLQLDTLTAAVQALPPQLDPCDATQQKNPKLKKRSKLLEAAQATAKAAATANNIGVTFLKTAHDSPSTIINTVDKININVSQAIIGTEADVQTLAQNLQKTITTEDKTIETIPNAKSATKDAAASTPPPSQPPAGPGAKVVVPAPPPAAAVIAFAVPYIDISNAATVEDQLSEAALNTSYVAGQILDIVGDNAKPPKNDACPTLAKTAGVPKELTLVPSGQVPLKKGSLVDITVAGAQQPYIVPLFPTLAVTGTLKENDVLEIAATKQAEDGEYPFFIGDGQNGQPIRAVINEAAQCPPVKGGKKPKKKAAPPPRLAAPPPPAPVPAPSNPGPHTRMSLP
jgi:hypothetical protein